MTTGLKDILPHGEISEDTRTFGGEFIGCFTERSLCVGERDRGRERERERERETSTINHFRLIMCSAKFHPMQDT